MGTQVKNHNISAARTTKSIWLDNALAGNRKAFADALCSLYYLPEQYRLVLPAGTHTKDVPKKYMDIMDRVLVTAKKGLSDMAAPFALICTDANNELSANNADRTPTVIVAANPEQYVKDHEWDGLTVPIDAPDALASAILDIARNSLAGGIRLIKQSCAL